MDDTWFFGFVSNHATHSNHTTMSQIVKIKLPESFLYTVTCMTLRYILGNYDFFNLTSPLNLQGIVSKLWQNIIPKKLHISRKKVDQLYQ